MKIGDTVDIILCRITIRYDPNLASYELPTPTEYFK